MRIKYFSILSVITILIISGVSLVRAAGSSYQFNQNLTVGSTGSDVIALQQTLINGGYLTSISTPTGYFGNGTKIALEGFQTANGISPASGYLGSLTRAVLNSLSGSSSSVNDQGGQSSQNISSSLINQIEPAIVLVVCFPPDYSTSGNLDYGSGVSINYGATTYIETNYHVYNGENTGGGSPTCFAYYPGPAPDFAINSQSGGYQLNFYKYNYNPDTDEDVLDFTLGAVAPSSTALTSIPVVNNTPLTGIGSGCSNVNSGDGVTIFGYPASGNYLDLSETVTQGTISGQTPGPIYKFDGAIDHGNSGGLAVLDKNSCYLGIPTLGVSGLTAGTGYIQSISLARQAVTLSNDQVCQSQYGTNSNYSGTKNSQGGLICDCASGYTWNTGNTACVSAETGYNVCAAMNATWDGTTGSNGKYNCTCEAGYVANGTTCVAEPSCPLFSSFNSTTNSCECDSGYSLYGGSCVSGYTYCTDTEGYGATYNAGTNSCACDYGYVYNGGQCEQGGLYCSARWGTGAEYDYSTGGCECMYGYYSNGSRCVSDYNY
jgi:peptidoglycan hydrolase-like protein with peptidoglycan-binding domain